MEVTRVKITASRGPAVSRNLISLVLVSFFENVTDVL